VTLDDVKALNPKGAVFVSRVSALELRPLGVRFQGGVIDEDAETAARERISEIDRRLADLRAGVLEDREQAQEEARLLTNERAGCVSKVGRELGVAVIPKSGTVTLSPGREADAGAVLKFLRSHPLNQPELCDEGFTELAA
jgi:hypothetical protein